MASEDEWWDNLVENPNKVKATDEFWAKVDSHPAFATNIDPSKELSADIAAMQALKFESEDPVANATSYKEEGNYSFSNKEYAKAIESYTAGLAIKADDGQLNTILYTNRAIANYHLGNFRYCIKDCQAAILNNPEHLKAYVRGAMAAFQLEKPEECLKFCVDGLKVDRSSETLVDLQRKILRKQVELEKARVLKLTSEVKKHKSDSGIRKLIESRGIKLRPYGEHTAVEIPEQFRECVYMDADKHLHWPILFLYPEFGQTDFLKDIVETSSLAECLQLVFNPSQEPPSWDPNRIYSVNDGMQVFIEDASEKVVGVPLTKTITRILECKTVAVRRDLVIVFIVVSKRSKDFYQSWTKQILNS